MAWVPVRLSAYAPDLPADAQPPEAWSSITNGIFRDGVVERSVGDYYAVNSGTPKAFYDFLQPLVIDAPGASTGLIYAGMDTAGPIPRLGYYVTGVGHTDITPLWTISGSPEPNSWTGGPLSGGCLVSTPGGKPVWVSAGGVVTVIGGGLKFNAVRPYRYMAVGIGDQASAATWNTVRWSASVTPGSAPSTWTPAATNDAGDLDVSSVPLGSRLTDGLTLGQDFILYSDASAHLMTYVGGTTVMDGPRKLPGSVGVLARNCVADVGGAHLVLSQDDVVLVGPNGPIKSLVDNRLRRLMFQYVQSTAGRSRHCQVWHDTSKGLVYCCVPSAVNVDAITVAWVYHIASDQWGFRDLYDADTTSSRYTATAAMLEIENVNPGYLRRVLVVARRNSSLASAELVKAETASGSLYGNPTELVKEDLDFGDAARWKLVRGVRVRGAAASACTVQVQVGTKSSPTEAYTYAAAQNFTLGSSQMAPFTVTGRWIAVKLTIASGQPAARIHGFDLDVVERGAW